jgi:signal peptidase I
MRYLRFIVPIVALWILTLLVIRQFVCIGWVVPVRVASDSMAPTLYGPHDKTTCQGCGHVILTRSRQAILREESAWIACLNCGHQTPTTASTPQVGSRVLIDRWAMRRGIRRFDIVAMVADGDRTPRLTTKRVIGMPGELISLRDGDVYADGAIVRKDAAHFAQMAILVHNDRHRREDAQPRWRGTERSRWTVEADGYRWRPPATQPTPDAPIDWLTYHHQPSPRVVTTLPSTAIFDDYEVNQGLSRALYRVHDLALAAELQWSGAGTLHVRCPTPLGTCQLRLAATKSHNLKSIQLWQGQTLLAETPEELSCLTSRNRIPVLVGFWDRQLICRVGDVEALSHCVDHSAARRPSAEPATQFALAATEVAEFRVTDLRIWRDLYYLIPNDEPLSLSTAGETTATALAPPLARNSYLLLGDNIPLSHDARYGAAFGIVSASQLLGIVVPVN